MDPSDEPACVYARNCAKDQRKRLAVRRYAGVFVTVLACGCIVTVQESATSCVLLFSSAGCTSSQNFGVSPEPAVGSDHVVMDPIAASPDADYVRHVPSFIGALAAWHPSLWQSVLLG